MRLDTGTLKVTTKPTNLQRVVHESSIAFVDEIRIRLQRGK